MSEQLMSKEELIAKIEAKERQLVRAESEAIAWNNKKGLNTSHAKMSIIMVDSLRNEISILSQQLERLSDDDT